MRRFPGIKKIGVGCAIAVIETASGEDRGETSVVKLQMLSHR
ncbi:hypothetical protein [Nostoc sp. ChiQUE01b]|nr:hypothetical protein [Nostoc sp. ChiQUE01b]MDZ8264594.1 hypothetical protein [Nostoc sp. ChiQUE01b]